MKKSNFEKFFNDDSDSYLNIEESDEKRTGDQIQKDLEDALPPSLVKHTDIEAIEIDEQKIIQDYNFARNSLISLAEKGQQTLQIAIDNAISSNKASDIDSVTSLLNVNGDIVTQLTELNLKFKESQERLKNVRQEVINQGTVNNFNIGSLSTAELLKMINETQESEKNEHNI